MIKATEKKDFSKVIHKIPAGIIPGDNGTEFFGDRRNMKVFFMHNGKTLPFREIGSRVRSRLLEQLMNDEVARKDLAHMPVNDALERYTYCLYGTLDHKPDVTKTGMLNGSDNFICGISGCNCMNWKSKQIQYDGQVIKGRLLQVLLAYRKGHDDYNVSMNLGIKAPTLNNHKKRLFEIFNVFNKTEMVIKAIDAKIIQ
jgi:DNA-binding CsgD family transcriptional regulator